MASNWQSGDASTLVERKMDEYIYVFDRRKDGNAEKKIHIDQLGGIKQLHGVVEEASDYVENPNPNSLKSSFKLLSF